MGEIEQVHNDIFLFVLGNGDDGYAKIVAVFKRQQAGEWRQAWGEIEQGKIEESWDVAPPTHCAGGIDMALDATQPCLVFVAISGDHSHAESAGSEGTVGLYHDATTYFGEDVVTEQVVRGKPTASIIKDVKRHKLPGSGYHTVCSFEVDVADVLAELGPSPEARTMTRFPIVFDFVDSDDGLSPVFKKPRGEPKPVSTASVLTMLGHGGIHPQSGSSIIELI